MSPPPPVLKIIAPCNAMCDNRINHTNLATAVRGGVTPKKPVHNLLTLKKRFHGAFLLGWTFGKYAKQQGCCQLQYVITTYSIVPAEKGHNSSFKIVRVCAGCSMPHTPRDLLHDEEQTKLK